MPAPAARGSGARPGLLTYRRVCWRGGLLACRAWRGRRACLWVSFSRLAGWFAAWGRGLGCCGVVVRRGGVGGVEVSSGVDRGGGGAVGRCALAGASAGVSCRGGQVLVRPGAWLRVVWPGSGRGGVFRAGWPVVLARCAGWPGPGSPAGSRVPRPACPGPGRGAGGSRPSRGRRARPGQGAARVLGAARVFSQGGLGRAARRPGPARDSARPGRAGVRAGGAGPAEAFGGAGRRGGDRRRRPWRARRGPGRACTRGPRPGARGPRGPCRSGVVGGVLGALRGGGLGGDPPGEGAHGLPRSWGRPGALTRGVRCSRGEGGRGGGVAAGRGPAGGLVRGPGWRWPGGRAGGPG